MRIIQCIVVHFTSVGLSRATGDWCVVPGDTLLEGAGDTTDCVSEPAEQQIRFRGIMDCISSYHQLLVPGHLLRLSYEIPEESKWKPVPITISGLPN